MNCIKHKFLFGLLLNLVIHFESVKVSTDAEDDKKSQKYLRKLKNTIEILATKMENKTCSPLPSTVTDFKTLDLHRSYLQENCQKEDAPCYSWNIAFIAGGKKFMVFLGFNDASDKKRDIKVTCIESGSLAQIEIYGTTETDNEQEHITTESISEGVYNPSITRRKQPPSTANTIQETDDGKESASVLENTSDEEMETDTDEIEDGDFLQCWKEYTKKILKRCRKKFNRNNNCAQNIYTSDDSPKYPGVGILVITHLLAAAIGCGILYLVLKKMGRLRNAKNKSEGNKGYTNSSYSQQENTTRITIPHTINDYNEGLYHEVESKMTGIQFDNQTKSNSFTKSIPSPGRKLSKLPDIPQEPEKDEYDYLIPQTGKDGSQTDKHLKYTGLIPEDREKELKTEDGTTSDKLDNSPKTSFSPEDKTDDYFVLEKSIDMDLK